MTVSQNQGLSARDFRTALDIDMAIKGINERELGKLLGLSQQSISKWRHRGFPPLYRVDDLKAIFGPDSNIGRMDFTQFAREVPKLRISAPPNVPETKVPRHPSRTFSMPQAFTVPQAFTDPTSAVRAWRSDQELKLVRGLPGALRVNLQEERGFPDYLSDKLAVGVVMSPRGPLTVPERAAERALRLLALRAERKQPELRLAVAIVQGDVPSIHALEPFQVRWDRALNALTQMAQQLSFEVWVVPGGAELALAICDIEGVQPREIPDDYEYEFEE